MDEQTGFSLLEVLISLMLVSTMGLLLLEQQLQSRQLLTHIVLRSQATQFLDQVDESLLAGVTKFPSVPAPYQFTLKKEATGLILSLKAFKEMGDLIREHTFLRAVK